MCWFFFYSKCVSKRLSCIQGQTSTYRFYKTTCEATNPSQQASSFILQYCGLIQCTTSVNKQARHLCSCPYETCMVKHAACSRNDVTNTMETDLNETVDTPGPPEPRLSISTENQILAYRTKQNPNKDIVFVRCT